jgi:hypothetical protein
LLKASLSFAEGSSLILKRIFSPCQKDLLHFSKISSFQKDSIFFLEESFAKNHLCFSKASSLPQIDPLSITRGSSLVLKNNPLSSCQGPQSFSKGSSLLFKRIRAPFSQ